MSFGLPPVKPLPAPHDQIDFGDELYGIRKVMSHGPSDTKSSLGSSHVVEASEKVYASDKFKMNMAVLRNMQGLHAPLRIAAELKAANQIGRHPFLSSCNLQRDVLLGRDLEIGFEDILNTPEFREEMGQPHAMMEKYHGIL